MQVPTGLRFQVSGLRLFPLLGNLARVTGRHIRPDNGALAKHLSSYQSGEAVLFYGKNLSPIPSCFVTKTCTVRELSSLPSTAELCSRDRKFERAQFFDGRLAFSSSQCSVPEEVNHRAPFFWLTDKRRPAQTQ